MTRSTDHRTLTAIQRHNEKLVRLCGLAAEIAKLGDERSTLQKIVDAAASLLDIQSAHLALVDRDDRVLYGVASSGKHRRRSSGLRFELSKSAAAGLALQRRKPLIINDAGKDARINPDARRILSIGGIMYWPLLSGKESFGLLILVTREARSWTAEDLELAPHFANFAAVALESARLLNRLTQTEGRFRSLVEHIPAIVYLCDVDPPYGTIYVNPQTEVMLGYPCSQWTSDPKFFTKLIHPDDLQSLVDLSHEAVRTTGFARSEYRLVDSRGEIRWFRDEAVLVKDPAGAPIAWHGVMVEITGLKKIPRPDAPHRRAGRALKEAPGPGPKIPPA
jgi:PAS domain S-box-containing protein